LQCNFTANTDTEHCKKVKLTEDLRKERALQESQTHRRFEKREKTIHSSIVEAKSQTTNSKLQY